MMKTELMSGTAEHADEPIPNESWPQVTATAQTHTPNTNQPPEGSNHLPSSSTEQQLGSMHLAGKGDSPVVAQLPHLAIDGPSSSSEGSTTSRTVSVSLHDCMIPCIHVT
jgi:hypothetical protein